MTVTRRELPGLAVGPMGAWLAAVGLLRAVHRADPEATLSMPQQNGAPVLRTTLDGLADWLADQHVFSPVVTPWQSGGGWGAKDVAPAARVAVLRSAGPGRLARLRAAVEAADAVVGRADRWAKPRLVQELRSWLPDDAVPWLDVAVPLHYGTSGVPHVAWAPLAGTHGNDARWDVSTNYHAAVLAVTGDRTGRHARQSADDLLDGTEHERLMEASGGPYWPAAGGLLNPWAMVLTVEGLLAFGGARTRVWADDRQPWTTRQQPAGRGTQERGLGEAWLPLWDQPLSMTEVTSLLGGPWPRGEALVRETFVPGDVPRGVTGYARYGLLQRKGRSHIAVPLATQPAPPAPPVWLSETDAHWRAGVPTVGLWRAWVASGRAPAPDRVTKGGREWLATTVEAYRAGSGS